MSRRAAQNPLQSTPSTLDNSDNPSWDGSALSRGPWYFALEKLILDSDSRYGTLLESGYTISKGRVSTIDKAHTVIIATSADTNTYGFENPAPIDPVEGVLPPLAAGAPPRTAADLTTAIAAKRTELETDHAAALTADAHVYSRFDVSPEAVKEVDRALMNTILITITDKTECDEYRAKAQASGRRLLRLISDDVKSLAGRQAAAYERMMTAHQAAGIQAPTLAAYNAYSRTFTVSQPWRA